MSEQLLGVRSPDRLPVAESTILGLAHGVVCRDHAGKPQVYFGGETVTYLAPHETVEMRDGAINVDMYTIEGVDDTDYALIQVRPPLYGRSATERGAALRFGGTKPAQLIERTPVQRFTSPRIFQDIPISGRARWLAVNPEGEFSTGLFDDQDPACANSRATFGEGWTFVWIVEGSRPFVFGELCTPRFIDSTETCPIGEAGIIELDDQIDAADLPVRFQELFDLYMSGEHLRVRS